MSNHKWRNWITYIAALIASIFAVYSLKFFLGTNFPSTREAFAKDATCNGIILFWALGIPLWFIFEHFVLWSDMPDQQQRVKAGRELVQPLWAAVLVILLFLVPGR